MTAALWTGVRAWMVGAALYVPEAWLTPEARQRAQIPASLRFQEKWRLALTLLRQTRAAAGAESVMRVLDTDPGSRIPERRAFLTPVPE